MDHFKCVVSNQKEESITVLPTKSDSDSDIMFCLTSSGTIIDSPLVHNPADRINTQVTYRFALAQVRCTAFFFT